MIKDIAAKMNYYSYIQGTVASTKLKKIDVVSDLMNAVIVDGEYHSVVPTPSW